MLTIITGTPGAGKTAYAVAELADLLDKSPRPVFVMGIPELRLPHEVAPEVAQWTRIVPSPEDASLLEAEFTFPDGALVVVDEAQKIYRPRSVGSKVPPHVAAFEKHRHKGLDFWLITQHPNLLDANLRKLAGKHVHLRGHWAGRELLEWPEVSDPDSKSDRASAVRRRYKLPKRVFGLYKSASLHVKQKRRLPLAVYVFVAVLGVAGVLGYRVFDRVSSAINGESKPAAASAAHPGSGAAAGAAAVAPDVLSVSSFKPRLNGRPESAPLYDGIRKVVAMPAVAGCMATPKRCTCYTEQGSESGLSDAECRAWLKAPPFNPFRPVYPPAAEKGGEGRPGPVQPSPDAS